MITRTVSSQGIDLQYPVPESVEEYNSLAPKRTNPCLEDAVANTLYRSVFAEFREKLVKKLEEVTGVKRINSGTEDEPKWESEGRYMRRLVVEVAQQRGMDPNAAATKTALMTEWQPTAQEIISTIKFDPTEREPSAAPAAAKTYLGWAGEAYDKDGGVRLATLLSKALNAPVLLPAPVSTGDTAKDDATNKEAAVKVLAQAISQNEKRKRDLESAKAKAEYLEAETV